MTIEEASVNINNPDLITAIKSAIVCTNTKDTYSSGFRNGLRYVIALLTDEEPKYEDVPKQDDAISMLKEQDGVVPYIDIDEAKCPVCKVKLTRQELIGDDVLFEDFFDYCPHCGKPVLWEGR